jgi:hypothetical protein
MYIDRNHVTEEFRKYTSAYDLTDRKVLLKVEHTYRVADFCHRIAGSLSLSVEETDFAWLSGMLHDIGRFEQLRRYHTFMDKNSVNHAELSADLLFREELISRFAKLDDEEADLMDKVIRNHNVYALPEELTERERMFCDILRDADKIDNFRGFHENDFYSFHERTPEEVQSSQISDGVVDCFMHHETIPFKVIQSAADFFLIPYALIFGIVYDESIQIADEQGYYKKMLDFEFINVDNRATFEIIKKEIRKHLDHND